MACDDAIGAVDEDWINKAKFPDAGGNLLNLFGRMGAGILRTRLQKVRVFVDNPLVPPIRDARFVDLNLAVFMCNAARRQERVCRAQRPAAKIDAIATSAGDRDRTSRI